MNINVLRSWLIIVVTALTLSLGMISSSYAGGETFRTQRVTVHLGQATNDLHSAHMAIRIGTNLLQHKAKVTLFLDREGVRIADNRVPWENLTWAGNNIAAEFDEFVNAGGKVLVCPGCAGDAGITEADLRPGAIMGNPDTVVGAILMADKILDY
jgi:sulfur relay (sulfurtransferase) complex TusBCD TusD component (DsrE family)